MSEVKTGVFKYDPELRFTNSGLPLLVFTLIETSTGEAISCQAWRDLAEEIAEDESYFGASGSIDVKGYFKTRTYQGKTYTDFIVQKIRHTP